MNHHADLVESVIRYCLRAAHHGQWHVLRDIGLGEDEIRLLLDLSVTHLVALERQLTQGGHPVEVRIDRAAFRRLLEDIRRTPDDSVRLQLVQAGAPHALLARLYGTSTREYTRMRVALGLPPCVGRPCEPDEETVYRVSQAWDARGRLDPGSLSGEDWLALAEDAGCDVRTVHRLLTQRWYPESDRDAGTRAPAPRGRGQCKPPEPKAPQVARIRRTGRA